VARILTAICPTDHLADTNSTCGCRTDQYCSGRQGRRPVWIATALLARRRAYDLATPGAARAGYVIPEQLDGGYSRPHAPVSDWAPADGLCAADRTTGYPALIRT